MRRVVLKSPVLENCTPGSVRGAPGNRRPYLAIMNPNRAEPARRALSVAKHLQMISPPLFMILSSHDSVI
jgi:hypothetical protein